MSWTAIIQIITNNESRTKRKVFLFIMLLCTTSFSQSKDSISAGDNPGQENYRPQRRWLNDMI